MFARAKKKYKSETVAVLAASRQLANFLIGLCSRSRKRSSRFASSFKSLCKISQIMPLHLCGPANACLKSGAQNGKPLIAYYVLVGNQIQAKFLDMDTINIFYI